MHDLADWLVADIRMDLYIYYRCAVEDAALVQAQVAVLQQALRSQYQARCGLKRRPAATNGEHTWMEIYLGVPADFGAVIDSAFAASALPGLLIGSRHAEHFLDCLPCA